jgi:hypothetical protein
MNMSGLCILGLSFSCLAFAEDSAVCKPAGPVESAGQAWCAAASLLRMESCASRYGFERTALDFAEFWILESKDKNPDRKTACRNVIIKVNKVSGEVVRQ